LQGNPADLPEALTTAVYVGVCGFWFLWSAAAIRCPACGARIGWYQMSHGSPSNAVSRFIICRSLPGVWVRRHENSKASSAVDQP